MNPGHYTIKISRDGYETHSDDVDVGPEEQVEHDTELEPEEETYLQGYISDSNSSEPVQNANVTVSDRKSTFTGSTDRECFYNISCKEGDYGIKITHGNYEHHEDRIKIKNRRQQIQCWSHPFRE